MLHPCPHCFSLLALLLPCQQCFSLLACASRWCHAVLRSGSSKLFRWCRIGFRGAATSSTQTLRHSVPASNIFPMALRCSALASNKPHPAEKRTPVWLAIWRIWAGFANSQLRHAANTTPKNICSHFPLLPPWAAAQTDANLSAHLHRLPTPPSYLRRMRLSPGHGRRCLVLDETCRLAGCGVPANHRAHESLF